MGNGAGSINSLKRAPFRGMTTHLTGFSMTDIKIPKAFYNFAADYALDAIEVDESPTDDMGELIDNALQYLVAPSDRLELREFLTAVLQTQASDEQLADLWSSGSSLLCYSKEAYRPFFTEIRDRL